MTLCPVVGLGPNVFSTFYCAAQYLLLWAVFAAPFAWDETQRLLQQLYRTLIV